MQLIWLTFEMIDDLDFQEWIQAQAKLPLGVRICEYLKMWYLVFGIRANTK